MLGLALLMTTWPSPVFGAEPHWQIGATPGLSSGKYGTDTRTEIVYTPLIARRLFDEGDLIEVTGTSKGRGFAGVVKRHGFRGGPKTHGQSDRWRAPGSIGSGTTPGRVVKGLRMAGHMGNERVTVQNLRVIRVDPARNLVAVKGAVPGPRGGLLLLKKRAKA